MAQNLAAVESSGERRTALTQGSRGAGGRLRIRGGRLSSCGKEAARRLAKAVEGELASLAMDKTRVEIRVTPAEWSAAGADAVEILISPNVGEELKPLEKIASGGELSRVALALKTCVAPARAEKHAIPRTLVFDEVDAGWAAAPPKQWGGG